MSDESTNTTEAPVADAAAPAGPPTTTEAPAATADATDKPLGESGVSALKAERKARRDAEKRSADFEARLREIEDREKTELQKANEAADRFRAEAEQRAAELARLKVASDTGLPADLVEFLTGTDEDTLRAQAAKLAAATAAPRTPQPDPGQGAKPDGVSQLSRADLAGMSPADIDRARVEGRLDALLAGNQ